MTEKGFWAFLNTSYEKGRLPMVSGRIDSGDAVLQTMGEYMQSHALLPKDHEKIPMGTIVEIGQLLFKREVSNKAKEAAMMILAHHGSDEALTALEAYNMFPDEELKIFAQMALDECYMWNEP